MLIRFTIMFFALLLFWSCEEVVELDVDFDPQVVVVSEIAPRGGLNRGASVRLSLARPILSQSPTEYVAADQVTITNRRSGQVTELFLQEGAKDTLNPDLFVFPFYFSGEHNRILGSSNYELNVKVAGKAPISAITTIPQRVDIQSLNFIDFSENPDPRAEDKFDIHFELSFNHDARIAGNYHLVFYFNYSLPRIEQADTVSLIQVPTVSNLTMTVPYTFDFENGVLIQGEGMVDGLHSLEAKLSVNYDEDTSPFAPILLVELRNTNTDYHNYHFNLSRQRSQQDSLISQAIIIPSNINNGLGIFSGYNFNIQAVRLTE